ncbi:trimethylguanosine synthase-like [Neltuma alba]|uniref:trimethylguanosine synthase-like n=1 Tax=Neltuma alba TaxID=207710 RepID=UPI0010A5062C|nr:trimethylguanosine synthase-like [Prosopis alba]
MTATKTSNLSQPQRVKGFRNPEASKEGISPLSEKYWYQRYSLFSKYDQGIQMDEEGWFSVTPEEIAIRHAERCAGHEVVIDSFSGVAGNAIQFARKGCHVIAIDIDPAKVALAMNNAKVYGVEEYIDFVVGDFFTLAPPLKGDIVFLSPPWGGPSYKDIQTFTLDLLKPIDGYTLFQVAQAITPNIIMFLPRNINLEQVPELSWLSSPPLELEVELNYVQNHLKGVTLYFGSTVATSPRFSSEYKVFPYEVS